MENILDVILVISNFLWARVLMFILIPLGIYFSIRTKFIQIRYFPMMWKMLLRKSEATSHDKQSGISGFQALMVSTASRVGTGNIVGVALAVHVGGPGALFWMWIVAFLGMATAIIENLLGLLYRSKNKLGNYYGGPALYIESLGSGKLVKLFSILFSLSTILFMGLIAPAIQSNTISTSFIVYGFNPHIITIVITITIAVIIFGGIHRIAHVTEFLVPIMAVLYIICALIIVVFNIPEVLSAFKLVFSSAFGVKEAVGGTGGYMFAQVINQGVRRGLFSNEAGLGSSPHVAAASINKHPIEQGFIQACGVFLDTIIVCTITGIVIIMFGIVNIEGVDASGIMLTQLAFTQFIGSSGNIIITVVAFFFAYSTIVGCYYYGEANIYILFSSIRVPLFLYRLCVIVLIFIAGVSDISSVWTIGDLSMGIMALLNLIAITLLSPIALSVVKDYEQKRKRGEEIRFQVEDLKEEQRRGIKYW